MFKLTMKTIIIMLVALAILISLGAQGKLLYGKYSTGLTTTDYVCVGSSGVALIAAIGALFLVSS